MNKGLEGKNIRYFEKKVAFNIFRLAHDILFMYLPGQNFGKSEEIMQKLALNCHITSKPGAKVKR